MRDVMYTHHEDRFAHVYTSENTAITKKVVFAKPSKKYCWHP